MATKTPKATDVAVASSSPEEENRNLPSTDVLDFASMAGMGREEARAQDYSIPFLKIIQKLSPEVDESDSKYIKGARPGDFLNTVTSEVVPAASGMKLIPCLFHREYVEWVPRTKGGGMRGTYMPSDPYVATATTPEGTRDLVLPNGNDLTETFYEYALCVTADGDVFPAALSFTSTQIRKIRKWISTMGQKKLTLPDGRVLMDPPDFAFQYDVTSVLEKNDKGSWYGWKIDNIDAPNDRASDALVRQALQFYKQVKSGALKRAVESDDDYGRQPGGDDEAIPGFEGAAEKAF